MGVCGGFIFCASNIYSGKHDNSIPVAKNPFKILVHVPHLESTYSEYNWIFLNDWKPCYALGLLFWIEFKLFNCLKKHAEGTKLSWNVLNLGNLLEAHCCFELKYSLISLWFRLLNRAKFHILEDLDYFVLIKQMMNTIFFFVRRNDFYFIEKLNHYGHEEIELFWGLQ